MITVNGKEEALPKTVNLHDWLLELGLNINTTAVEHNGSILGAAEFANITLKSGDQIEIVSFVGGG